MLARRAFSNDSLADRIRARPSWQRLYEIEGLTEWI
jgi:hypothetical protein